MRTRNPSAGTTRNKSTLHMGPASQQAVDTLMEQKIMVGAWANQPDDEPPDVPRDITTIRDAELMELYRKLNQWVKYLTIQVAAAQADESYAETAVSKIEGKKGYDFRRTGIKEKAWADQDYVKAKDTHQEAFAYRKMAEALLAIVDKGSFHVSRELTRRVGKQTGQSWK